MTEVGFGTSRTSGDVRLESAKCAKADLNQVAAIIRDFMSNLHHRILLGCRILYQSNGWSGMSLRERCAYHEAGQATAALTFAIPIIAIGIADDRPHLHRGHYHAPDASFGLECMVTLCLGRTRSGKRVLRPHHRRQRPRRLRNGPREYLAAASPTRCKPRPNSPATVTPRNGWCVRLGHSNVFGCSPTLCSGTGV